MKPGTVHKIAHRPMESLGEIDEAHQLGQAYAVQEPPVVIGIVESAPRRPSTAPVRDDEAAEIATHFEDDSLSDIGPPKIATAFVELAAIAPARSVSKEVRRHVQVVIAGDGAATS